MRARLLLALVLVSALGCRSAGLPPPATTPAASPGPAASTPVGTVPAVTSAVPSDDPDTIRWVRDSTGVVAAKLMAA